MKLGGWTRLGIVITALWVIAVGAWCIVEYRSNHREDTYLIQWNDNKPKPWELDWSETDLRKGDVFDPDEYLRSKGMSQTEIDRIPVTPEIKWSNLLILLIVPCVFLWGIGVSVNWVTSGFKRNANKSE